MKWEALEGYDRPSQVIDRLWVGSVINAKDARLLNSLGITHILNATAEEDNYYEDQFVYHRVPLYDRLTECASPFFNDAIAFIKSALAADGTVLIHCQEGISRSPTVALAFRMITEELPLRNAYRQLRSARPEIEPNGAFLQDLRELEA